MADHAAGAGRAEALDAPGTLPDPAELDTLAACRASVNDFASAATLQQRAIDDILAMGDLAEGSDAASVMDALGAQVPMLVFNRELAGDIPESAHWDLLMLDNVHGAELATAHLIAQGHRRIAFFGGHAGSSSCQQRRSGFLKAMKRARLKVPKGYLVESAPTRLDAARACDALFAADPAPTAAVCYNDAVALGLMLGLSKRGLQPGRDFALTGFDNIGEAAVVSPPLTTVSTDPRERGRQAARLLLTRLGHPQERGECTIVPVELVVRESSCPPPAA